MTAGPRGAREDVRWRTPSPDLPGTVRLASNEMSAGPVPRVLAAIAVAAVSSNRYPDAASAGLVDALAVHLGVDAARVAIGSGSATLCRQLLQITCAASDEVLFARPSFQAYPLLVRSVGAVPVPIDLAGDYMHDLEAMAMNITPTTRVVFVCNPNNPTGTALRRGELERFLDRIPSDVLVVLDEAYREFVTDPQVPDGIELADGRPNVAVLRTFSKAHGLAGLRVGYCVAAAPVTTALRKVDLPFSVNAVAQAAAIASLTALDEIVERCAAVTAERERVRAGLLNLGYVVPATQANFVWLPLRERTTDFHEHCLQHNVVVRPFTGTGARVTIGSADENEVFLNAAATFAHPGEALDDWSGDHLWCAVR